MNLPALTHLWTTHLSHTEGCSFLGYSPQQHLYIEEFYEDEWFAQHQLDRNGNILFSVDEASGTKQVNALELPPGSDLPPAPPADHPLNLPLLREWGMREADRVQEWVQPLTIIEKMALIGAFSLALPPMLLLGLAESRVLAQVLLSKDHSLICRRLRLAVALPQIRQHPTGLPYDYETIPCSVLQMQDIASDESPSLASIVQTIGGVTLLRPLDCLTTDNFLFLAEGGDGSTPCRVHSWKLP